MQPPSATIACNNNPCGSGAFTNAVSVTMNATDSGGSGVDQIIYTLDGTTPSLSNGIPYLGAFSVNTNTTIKFVALDRAGNLGAVNTEVLTVDATPPVSTISCNNAACAGSYNAAVTVRLSADDGVRLGGRPDPLHDRRLDPDGNDRHRLHRPVHARGDDDRQVPRLRQRRQRREPANSQLIQIDTTAPDGQPDRAGRRRDRHRHDQPDRERLR